jgi:hypothetical protein
MKTFLKRKRFYQDRKVNRGIEAKRCQMEIVFWKERIHQLSVLKFLSVDLIVEFFVLFKKPEYLSQKFSYINGEGSHTKNIGTIFIALQHHWTNGYCVSSSSSDDD